MYFRAVGSAPPFVRLAGHPLRWRVLAELARSDLRVRELVTRLDEPQSLVSYHLRMLRDGGLVTASRSSFDGRDSYYHLDLDGCAEALAAAGAALHPALAPDRTTPIRPRPCAVLFVCTGNSARSPIAEALLRRETAGQVRAISAGSHPRPQMHPHAVRVLRDRFGIDVAGQQPRHLDTLAGHRFDHVITLCDRAREICPDFGAGPRRTHWSIAEPADYPDFARIADTIATRVRHLLPVLATTEPREVTP
jgi:ArsR family transcriptional regulator, arsenate/arsenite/antimonite-responsive transcriptional repressor / arsenate reductase (thioredoxin)